MGTRGDFKVGLKAPSIITFLVSIILTVTVLIMKFFSANIPYLNGNEFWALLVAQLLLILGCLTRNL